MEIDQFELAAANYLAGQVSADELTKAAAELIPRVANPSEHLVELAALDGNTAHREDVLPLMRTTLREFERAELTPKRTADLLVRDVAKQIRNGRISPVNGANRIWGLWRDYVEDEPCAADLLQLADKWEESLPDRAQIDDEIKEVAFEILKP